MTVLQAVSCPTLHKVPVQQKPIVCMRHGFNKKKNKTSLSAHKQDLFYFFNILFFSKRQSENIRCSSYFHCGCLYAKQTMFIRVTIVKFACLQPSR